MFTVIVRYCGIEINKNFDSRLAASNWIALQKCLGSKSQYTLTQWNGVKWMII